MTYVDNAFGALPPNDDESNAGPAIVSMLRNLLVGWRPPLPDAETAAQLSQREQQRRRQQSLSAAPADVSASDMGLQPTFAAQPFGSLAPTLNDVPLPRRRPAAADADTSGLYDSTAPMPANDTNIARRAPAPAAQPGGLDRLGNFLNDNSGMFLAMGAGFGGARNFSEGMGRAFNNAAPFAGQNQTVQMLIGRGMAPDLARVVAANPSSLQQVLMQMSGARQFQHVTVKDSLGNEIPLAFDPSTRRYYMPNGQEYGAGQGTGGLPGVGGGFTAMPIEIDPTTGRDEQFLAALKKQDPVGYSTVVGLLNGDVNAQGRNMQKYLPYAARAEQGFNMQAYQARLRTMNDFTPQGVSGKNITAINTGLGHVERLEKAIDNLGNFSIAPDYTNPVYNTVRGQFSPNYQKNSRLTAKT